MYLFQNNNIGILEALGSLCSKETGLTFWTQKYFHTYTTIKIPIDLHWSHLGKHCSKNIKAKLMAFPMGKETSPMNKQD